MTSNQYHVDSLFELDLLHTPKSFSGLVEQIGGSGSTTPLLVLVCLCQVGK